MFQSLLDRFSAVMKIHTRGQCQGVNSTPATVRQLQEEVQRLRQRLTQANAHEEKLRQRVQQANAKEEKQRVDLARNQRWVRDNSVVCNIYP